MQLVRITSGHVESFLQDKAQTLAPQTINHLRRYVLTAFNRAREAGRYADNRSEAPHLIAAGASLADTSWRLPLPKSDRFPGRAQ